jgi:hypothetical protein
MKVLFLDIDGVLNSHRTVYARKDFPHGFDGTDMNRFDPIAIDLIRDICDKTGASIVLSSSWRILHSVHECANGLDLPIFDKTPINAGAGVRGDEIQAWLSDHPEVTQYAIIDDDSDMLPEQATRFVKTDHKNGLMFGDYESLIAILGSLENCTAAGGKAA